MRQPHSGNQITLMKDSAYSSEQDTGHRKLSAKPSNQDHVTWALFNSYVNYVTFLAFNCAFYGDSFDKGLNEKCDEDCVDTATL